MGYDCVNYLPKSVKHKDVTEFLTLLGYDRVQRSRDDSDEVLSRHYYFKDDDYKHISGVVATVYRGENGIQIYTRTNIWRAKADAEINNWTIMSLKKRFGGYFVSDEGKNRYSRGHSATREKAEAGCYAAYERFKSNTVKIHIYLQNRQFKQGNGFILDHSDQMNRMHPVIIANNLMLPFLVSAMEDYFRATLIALFKFSDGKESFFKATRITSENLVDVANGDLNIYEAAANSMSFQSLQSIAKRFREVDSKFDFAAVLKRPYRRRKQSLYDSLEEIIVKRHLFIHSNEIHPNYKTEALEKDIEDMQIGIERVYKALIKHFSWHEYM